jgi:hypothetical protein
MKKFERKDMDEQSKKGHLYASKIIASMILLASGIGILAAYDPILMVWIMGSLIALYIFGTLYRLLYEIGKSK